jgi:hypothetical protein
MNLVCEDLLNDVAENPLWGEGLIALSNGLKEIKNLDISRNRP